MALRVVAGIFGAFFLLQAVQWIATPSAAAEALGMPLLTGVGRSTQIGDVAGLFLALGSMILLGVRRSDPHWLRAGALLLGSAAVMRTLAWALHGAAFAGLFIAVEAVTAGVLLFVAARLEGERDPAAG
jgi:hypothetical protein